MKRAALITSAVLGLGSMVADSIATELQQGKAPKEARFERQKQQIARRFAISVPTIEALTFVESSNKPRAQSGAGAYGLMQINKAHIGGVLCPEARTVEDLFNPAINTTCGARILRYELNRYGDDLALALAAYNGGPKCVKDGRIVCKESRIHSERVLLRIARDLGN